MYLIGKSMVKIRPMTAPDVDSVLSMDWAEIPEKEMVRSQRGGRLDASFIAELEGVLIGFVLARIIYVGRPMTGVCQLNLIAVRPDQRKKGVAAILLDQLQRHCQARGIGSVRALVDESDRRLREYFERAGFKPSSVINYDKPAQ